MNCFPIENHPHDSRVKLCTDGIVQTLPTRMGTGGNNTPFVLISHRMEYPRQEIVMTEAYMAGNGQLDQVQLDTVSRTLDCMHDQKMVLINIQEDSMENDDKKYVLRRLTPTECARLQGFPDWWCDGANGSDSSQYKLWGNGVALPCVAMILENIAMDAMKGETNE